MEIKTATTTAAIAAPSLGPSVLYIFGLQIPVAAMVLSLIGLALARYLAPESARKLTLGQERALTALLALLLIVIVSGELSACQVLAMLGLQPDCPVRPLGVGMATAWGIGLGTSGLLAVEFIGTRFMDGLRAAFRSPPPAGKDGEE